MYQNRTKYPAKKNNIYKMLSTYTNQYNNIALIRMEKVRASQISSLRKKLKDTKIFSIKDRIAKKALTKVSIPGMDKIVNGINGQCMLVFTDTSPFKLSTIFTKNKTMLLSRNGDTSNIDVIIPAKNTGIAPGPILTDFKENGIPTKIDQGTVWITKDTTVIKNGEKISAKLASILGKLNIKPIEATVKLNMALEEDNYYNNTDLIVDINWYNNAFLESYASCLSLSIECNYITPESIDRIIIKLVNRARNISINAAYLNDDNTKEIIIKANSDAVLLSAKCK